MGENFDVETLVYEPGSGRLIGGVPELMARVFNLKGASMDWGRETALRAARIGSEVMERQAPSSNEDHSDFPLRSPAAAGLMDAHQPDKLNTRIDYDAPKWYPGGAGGGGYWSVGFGVQRDPQVRADRDPASLVFHGTGRRGDHLASGGNIRPAHGNVMTWMEGGHQVFTHSTGGQRENKKWVYMGRAAARGEIGRRIAELNLRERRP